MIQRVVSAAFLYQGDRVLLARRSASKEIAPNVWHLPGGHVEYGEDTYSAIKREIKEEFGLKIKVGVPFESFSYINDDGSHTIGVVHFATPVGPVEPFAPSIDHSECLWVVSTDLDKLMGKQGGHNLSLATKGFEALKCLNALDACPPNHSTKS
jgi:8-oxo-dGTP diphosphatase